MGLVVAWWVTKVLFSVPLTDSYTLVTSYTQTAAHLDRVDLDPQLIIELLGLLLPVQLQSVHMVGGRVRCGVTYHHQRPLGARGPGELRPRLVKNEFVAFLPVAATCSQQHGYTSPTFLFCMRSLAPPLIFTSLYTVGVATRRHAANMNDYEKPCSVGPFKLDLNGSHVNDGQT